MHDFGTFCYLDVQKTGSSFISQFLRAHVAVPQVRFRKHGRVNQPSQLAPGKLFFISARDPLELYKSLYFFGVREKGALHNNLLKRDPAFGRLYDNTPAGFAGWLDFVLAEPNHPALGQGYEAAHSGLYGFMSYRFLALSFFRPRAVLADCTDRAGLIARYEADRLHSVVLRNESLNQDLANLIAARLRSAMRNADAAIAELRAGEARINVSPRNAAADAFAPSREQMARLRAREWFLYDVLGYATLRTA